MAELIPGRKYSVLLDKGDTYKNTRIPDNSIVEFYKLDTTTDGIIIRYNDSIYYIDEGFEIKEVPPAEAEAYTMIDGESHYITMDPMQFPHGIVVPREIPPPHLIPNELVQLTNTDTTHNKIALVCDKLKHMLQEKNRKYGDSALSSGIAFDIPATTAIKARINDKLARLKNDNKDEDEDIIEDLLGYFILLKIANGKY